MSDNNKSGTRIFAVVLIVIIVLVIVVQLFIKSVSDPVEQEAVIASFNDKENKVELAQDTNTDASTAPLELTKDVQLDSETDKNIIEQDHSFTEHAPHPWELIEVTPAQEQLCRDMELQPLAFENVYDEDLKANKRIYSDYYDLSITILHNSKEYSLSSVYGKQTEKWVLSNIKRHLNRVYESYSMWLGAENLFKAPIDIKLAINQSQYFNALAEHGAEESASVQGVYLPLIHQAFVKIPFNEKGQILGQPFMRTLVHEAVHAVNFVQFGYMQRWLQEGLAQYFAHYVDHAAPELFLDYDEWEIRSGSLGSPLTLQELIYPSDHWLEDRQALYATSFAFVQYFSELPEPKNLLLTILKTENTQRCSSLNKQWVESTLDPENLLYSNIQSWFDHTVIYFSERVEEYKLEQKKALPKQ